MSEIEMKSLISKYQRRDFVRYHCKLPIHVRIRKENSVQRDTESPAECLMLEISGRGLCFASNLNLPKDTCVECDVEMHPGEITILEGTVVRTDEVSNSPFNFKISLQFTDIDELLRRKIIKFIFIQQIKLRLKQNKTI